MTNHEKTLRALDQPQLRAGEADPRDDDRGNSRRLNSADEAVWDAAWALHDPEPNGQQWRRSKALKDAIDALIAAVRAEQPAWQSIETAPKDGTRILGVRIWSDGSARYEVLRHEDRHWTDGEYTYDPTHWMPLPSPPSEET